MFTTYKTALGRITADNALKENTTAYLIEKLKLNENAPPRARAYVPPYRRLAVALCALVLLCALPVGGYALYQVPVSYLSVDINPSIELGINSFGRIVSVTPYNNDGETVLEGLSLTHLKVSKAVGLIVNAASENGFILDDGSSFISITAETNNDHTALQLEQEAKNGAEEAIAAEDDNATILTDQIALERRDDAIALGITPGKLNLIEKLQELDDDIKTEDYKDASVKEIQEKYHELQKGHDGSEADGSETDDTEEEDNDDADVTASISPSPSSSPSPDITSSATPNGTHANNNGNTGSSNHNNTADGKDDTNSYDGKPHSEDDNDEDEHKNDNQHNNSHDEEGEDEDNNGHNKYNTGDDD